MFGYLADLDYFESPSSSSSSNSGEASIENENLVNETVEHLDSLMQIISPFLDVPMKLLYWMKMQ